MTAKIKSILNQAQSLLQKGLLVSARSNAQVALSMNRLEDKKKKPLNQALESLPDSTKNKFAAHLIKAKAYYREAFKNGTLQDEDGKRTIELLNNSLTEISECLKINPIEEEAYFYKANILFNSLFFIAKGQDEHRKSLKQTFQYIPSELNNCVNQIFINLKLAKELSLSREKINKQNSPLALSIKRLELASNLISTFGGFGQALNKPEIIDQALQSASRMTQSDFNEQTVKRSRIDNLYDPSKQWIEDFIKDFFEADDKKLFQ